MNKEVIILELASLIRSLDFIQEEQAFIKSKLTGKLDSTQDITLLNWVEDIQQQIINRELAIQLLKKDVQQLDRIFNLNRVSSSIDEDQMSQFKNDKEQVQYLEKEFFVWKNNVNHQLELTTTS
ncbi:MAG: hypothetical protein ACO22Y_04420 [Sediminibacterium sp.]|jgi:hypothetical protein